MTMTDLTEIDGVGPSYAEELASNGYTSAEDVAAADADELDDVIDTHNGADLKDAASEVAGPQEDTEDVAEVDDEEYFELDFEISEDQRNHLIKGLVNEEIRARRTNKAADVESAKAAINEVLDGAPYEFTKQQLDTAYRAVSQLEAEYRSQRGVGTFVTQIRNLKNNFQEARQDAHPPAEA